MATYYVRKTGSDATGDGSTGNPWLTIHKAIVTIPAAGGHTILVGDGLYQENSGSGYFDFNSAFTNLVTIAAELGAAGAVEIQGLSSATYNTVFRKGNITWQWITFGQR